MRDESSAALIPLSEWKAILDSFGPGGAPLPFVQEIFLIQCTIAGTTHVEKIEEKTAELIPGTLLAFRREPENPFDALAILILNGRGEKIGYVPRAKNEVLARLMDAGKLLFGRVEAKTTLGDWINISVKVFMRDL